MSIITITVSKLYIAVTIEDKFDKSSYGNTMYQGDIPKKETGAEERSILLKGGSMRASKKQRRVKKN